MPHGPIPDKPEREVVGKRLFRGESRSLALVLEKLGLSPGPMWHDLEPWEREEWEARANPPSQ